MLDDTLNNNDIAASIRKYIRKDMRILKATAIGSRSYYYQDEDGTHFVSYWTPIATIKNGTIHFDCQYLDAYSQTTMKHLNQFLQIMKTGKRFSIADIRKRAKTWSDTQF